MISAGDMRAADLPDSLREMVEEVGFEAVLRLVEAFAGQRLYVPSQEDGKLAASVGGRMAAWLAERWGGDLLYVPRAARAVRLARNRRIILDYDQGTPPNTLASRYTLTERHVRRILSDPDLLDDDQPMDRKGPRQLSLPFE